MTKTRYDPKIVLINNLSIKLKKFDSHDETAWKLTRNTALFLI